MKILCLQLARFGDIYQTWPVLSAIRRIEPEAEIHFMVRERFQSATTGLAAADRIILHKSSELMAPLYAERPNIEKSLRLLGELAENLRSESYDRIINLSFSPVSSYLTDLISAPNTVVTGYTRYRDGYLCIPDDASSYFYAQVGVDRSNRIHLTDLFALVAGVELTEDDFVAPRSGLCPDLPNKYIVVHVGASARHKMCSPQTWHRISQELLLNYEGHIVFVGSSSEKEMVPKLEGATRIINKVGDTGLEEIFGILNGAEGLIGCDSVAVHMASLVGTPTLNITFPTVRFWETGPRAKGSRILWFESDEKVDAPKVANEVQAMLNRSPASDECIEKVETFGVLYKLNGFYEDDFTWELTKALYMAHPFPAAGSVATRSAFERLEELAVLALEQIPQICDSKRREIAVSILDQVDVLIDQVGRLLPRVSPVVRWFQTEKSRIGPGKVEEVMAVTRSIFEKLRDVCQLYRLNESFENSLPREELTWKS